MAAALLTVAPVRTHPVKTPERGKSGSDFEFRQLARERVDARPMA